LRAAAAHLADIPLDVIELAVSRPLHGRAPRASELADFVEEDTAVVEEHRLRRIRRERLEERVSDGEIDVRPGRLRQLGRDGERELGELAPRLVGAVRIPGLERGEDLA
jgi:hypothetical protein